jgi:hypothetical protein
MTQARVEIISGANKFPGHRVASPQEVSFMIYDFLVETYETERIKVVSMWSEFRDEELAARGGPAGTQRSRANGASMRQRGHLVSDDVGN